MPGLTGYFANFISFQRQKLAFSQEKILSLKKRLGFSLLVAGMAFGQSACQDSRVEAAHTSTVLNQVLEQLQNLEADNQSLKQRVAELEAAQAALPPPEWHQEVDELFKAQPAPPAPNPITQASWEEEFACLPAGEMSAEDCLVDEYDLRLRRLENALRCGSGSSGKQKFPTAELTGVFQADAGWFKQDQGSLNNYGAIPNGVDFRRFRLAAKGKVAENTNYFAQVDFGFVGRPTIQDLYVEQTDVPIFGNVRLGQWKQPFSLEVVSSFRYTTFMERSVLFIPFTAFRHMGVGFQNVNEYEDITWAASFFAAGNDQFGGSTSLSGGYGSAERITFLPFWNEEDRRYLHLGFGHYFSAPNNHTVNFRTQPEAFVGVNPGQPGTSGSGVSGALNGTPPFVSTGNIHVDNFNVLGTELLWVRNRLTLQSEAMVNFVETKDQAANGVFMPTNQGTAVLPGAYAQVSYFLTDDYRPYDRKTGSISRINPRNPVGSYAGNLLRGQGAWEVAARWSHLELNDRQKTNLRGGEITDYTLGVNWYTTPYTKFVFNYIHSISEPGVAAAPIMNTQRASTDIFMTRFQLDF